jgi:glycosyltransferase involved in cell wall biosynthesis
MTPIGSSLRIALVAPPLEAVPPPGYGGTERVIDELARELDRRGHQVTVFASGDSSTAGALVPTVERALRPTGRAGEDLPYFLATLDAVLRRADEFAVIHAHLDFAGVLLARISPTPVVATFHGRLDRPWAARFLEDPPPGLCAISVAQASAHPEVPWSIVPDGLSLAEAPFGDRPGDALCFVGRMSPEKGAVDAIAIARRTGRRLLVAAKEPTIPLERDYFENVFRPAARTADVEYLGELGHADRDRLFAESYASLMPGDWPEPFGLVAIESLATGTPVIARRVGGIPEIVRDGVDGVVDDTIAALAGRLNEVGGLDRPAIRASVLDRFSVARMTDGYEAVYARVQQGRWRRAPVGLRIADGSRIRPGS